MECGVGYYTASLVEQMSEASQNLTVLTAAPAKEIESFADILVARGWRIRDLLSLVRQCKEVHADIIHIQYPAVGYGHQLGINLLPWLLRLNVRSSRLVITLHEYFGSRLIGRIRNLITIIPAQTVIVSNQADQQSLPGFLRSRVSIIPLGSSIETTSPNTEAAKTLLHNDKGFSTILFFGFAFPSKRLELLIDTMKLVTNKQLVVAANLNHQDSYHEGLVDAIKAHNKSVGFEQIRIIGSQPRDILTALLQQSSCFVLPQAIPINGKSSTLVTAIRCGAPIIGKKGSSKENWPLANQKNALLIEEITNQSLAEAVNALDNPELVRTLKAGLAELAGRYSWNTVVAAHMAIYEAAP